MNKMEFQYQDVDSVRIEQTADEYRFSIGERNYRVQVVRAADGVLTFLIDGQPYHALTAREGSQHWVALGSQLFTLTKLEKSTRRRVHGQTDGSLTASMPGQVVKVMVNEGDVVTQGQPLLVLEAMKMEVRLNAPHAGSVTKLLCSVGQIVERGQALLELVETT
jgi:acetyl/propionyl-CoA carboxylase alpha subunit